MRFRDSRHVKSGKVVTPTHRPPLPQGDISGTHFSYRVRRPQVYSAAGRMMPRKIPMAPSGIEPVTFLLVAQYLNQLRHIPLYKYLAQTIFNRSILKVSSVKTQLIYCHLKWRHVSTHRVIIRLIIEPCLRYIK